MKYFGIIKREEIEGYSIEEIENHLVEKGIYQNNFSNDQMVKILDPSYVYHFNEIQTCGVSTLETLNEFHEFIFKRYQEFVINVKYKYFTTFNTEFYGLEYSELRKIALSDFNEMYSGLEIDSLTLFNERSTINGTTHTSTTGKLFKLYFYQLDLKKSVATTENIVNYLIGDVEFYNENFYNENFEVRNAVHLEIIKQILVELNDKYSFEEDIYYSKKVSDTLKFRDYNYIFNNLKSYQFTNNVIRSNKNLKRVDVESLYQVLLACDSIKDHKENFIAFIKDEYNFKLPKITTFAVNQNRQNEKRVKLLTQEWENHDVEKTSIDLFSDF